MGILFRAAGKKKRFAAEAPAYITITPVSVVGFVVSNTVQLGAQLYGTRGTALQAPIAWSSSDVTKATVSTTGLLTAVGAGAIQHAHERGLCCCRDLIERQTVRREARHVDVGLQRCAIVRSNHGSSRGHAHGRVVSRPNGSGRRVGSFIRINS